MTSINDSDIPLLGAKLHRPRVTRDLVVRPRLLERLDAGLGGPLTVVVAPAGFGKTTLVSSWIEALAAGRPGQRPLPAAWLSLDEGDSEPSVFLRYFIGALRTLFPDAAPRTLELLSGQMPPLDVLAGILSNEIEALPSSFIVVLDDAHLLSGQDVIDFLTIWTRHWPRPLHLMVVSRLTPSLPLTTLRARDKAIELRSRDLRFTPSETAEYFDQVLGITVAEPALVSIHEQLEGWIAGLKLATLSPVDRDLLIALPQTVLEGDVHIADYLLDEVLLRQPADIQRCLLKISIASQFCQSLCEALLVDEGPDLDVRRCLKYLEANELFLTALDNRHEWYRLHQLLRDLLQQRLLNALGEEQVNVLHGRAARWYASQDLLDQALHHAVEGHDLLLAGQIMQQGLCDVLNRTARPTLERWLRLLPDNIVRRQPELLMMRAYDHALRWELPQTRRVVEQIDVLLAESKAKTGAEPESLLRGQLAAMKGHNAYLANQLEEAIAHCREALALMPREWSYVRAVGALYLGLSLHDCGYTAEAERFLTTQYEAAENKTDIFALRLLQTLAFNELQSGFFDSAERTIQVMLLQSEQGGVAVMRGWSHYLLGHIYYQWNDLETAEKHFAATVEKRYTTQLLVARNGLIGLAATYQAHGDPVKALEMIDELSLLDVGLYGREGSTTSAARARLLLRQNDLEDADLWSRHISLPLADQPLLPWMDEPLLTRIAVLIARNAPGDIETVAEALDAMEELSRRNHNSRTLVEILALRALAQMTQGDITASKESLIKSIELSRRSGQIRPYIDLGPPMFKLLGLISGQRTVAKTVKTILAAFEEATRPDAAATFVPTLSGQNSNGGATPNHLLPERLTPRELEVLTLMTEPMSLAEIAERLFITRGTARRHTINLYQKLDVHGRWEAVSRAVELGILLPR